MSSVRNVQVNSIVIYQAGADGLPIGANKDVYQGATVCNADGTTSPAASKHWLATWSAVNHAALRGLDWR